ncbi:MAG TPA: hypothetical protein VIW24_01600 [Aldersonia sp.]
MLDWYRVAILDTGRSAAVWALLGFVVTFGVTRWITVTIRARKAKQATSSGPIKDIHIGGVHVHHQVWGILMVLVTGLLQFRFSPASPWVEVLATLFGVGAALALDEFALWLHLEDVYWSEEGRKSIDAVLVAVVVGLALLVATSPVGLDEQDSASGVVGVAVTILIHISFVVVCLLKGKLVTGLVGLPMPIFAFVGACRIAQPDSFWARRFYRDKPRKLAKSQHRYHRLVTRRERLRDTFGGRV